MKKIISYSLWGTSPRYTLGAIANSQQVPVVYPGWTARFYCGTDVPHDILQSLMTAGAEIILMDEPNDSRGMFWRFYALADPEASHIIFRDADSYLSRREAAAVNQWVTSNFVGHIMRDHPYHTMPIMGGMWGCKGGVFTDIQDKISAFCPRDSYNQDQIFLARCIYPKLREFGCIVHDEFYRYESSAKNFPLPRHDYEFVGEVILPDGSRDGAWKAIQAYENNPLEKIKLLYRKYKHKIKFSI